MTDDSSASRTASDRSSVVGWYETHAEALAPRYESVRPLPHSSWLSPFLPKPPALVIDIGAGTGRDAAAFALLGYEVVAVEPAAAMRREASSRHPEGTIRWLNDALPGISTTLRAGLAADVVCLSAVWQHVAPPDRRRAFRKMVGLLRSGGVLVMTLRQGPDDGRGGFAVSLGEIETLARQHGMQILLAEPSADALGRAEISWTNVVLQLPDDGTGALPLLRHIILNDAKSGTYKLGLLRALCRAADLSAGLAVPDGDESVQVPLGLVALNWLRLYAPLIHADLPQTPVNRRGGEKLGFAGEGWRALMAGAATVRDLRLGAVFGPEEGRAVRAALQEAIDHICRMPAYYLTFPNGGQIFVPTRRKSRQSRPGLILDAEAMASFGWLRIPRHLWMAMSRFAAWIEPAITAEWIRLMEGYAATQGRRLDAQALASAMVWSEAERDVGIARARTLDLLQLGAVHCVWTGKRLSRDAIDIDHCIPWSAWPCGDLWNLLPADRRVNQRSKRERLPSAATLQRARDAISSWWDLAYLSRGNAALATRFASEARASLPVLANMTSTAPDDVFDAVAIQRLRLSRDQGIPEWDAAQAR